MTSQKEITRKQQKIANACARANGHGTATTVIFDSTITKAEVRSHTPYGYRKHTTGEYVSNAYRNNFGWKNTYYQCALTVVAIPLNDDIA